MKLWDWSAYPERTRWKIFTYQKSACWCKLVRSDISNIMQANYRWICIKLSEKTGAYIYPLTLYQLALTGWFLAFRFFFHLVLSEYANQYHNFTNLNLMSHFSIELQCIIVRKLRTRIIKQCSRLNDDDVIFTLEMENCLKINLIKWINRQSQMDYLMSKMNTATKSD